mgnify:CR=1 FL=1
MSNWQTRIEDVTGSVGDTTFLTNALGESLQEVVNVVDDKHLECLIVEVATDDSNPVGLPDDSGRLLDVFREDGLSGRYRECKEVPLYLEARIQDGGSIYAATATEPLFVKKSGGLYVYPAPSANSGVRVLYFDTDIAIAYDGDYGSTPADFNVALKVPILYKAIEKTLTKLMVSIADGLPADPFSSLPSPPAPPEDLNFASTDGDINVSSISSPVFVAPSLSLSYTNFDTALTDEDEEMATAHQSKLSTQLSEYEALLGESTQLFEESKIIFDKEFEQLKHNAEKVIDRKDKESANKLEVFGKEMDVYKEQIDKEVNYFKELIAKSKEKYTVYKDTLDVYKELYKSSIEPFLPEDKKSEGE